LPTVVRKETKKIYSARLTTGRMVTITQDNCGFNLCIDNSEPEHKIVQLNDLHIIKDVLIEAINDGK